MTMSPDEQNRILNETGEALLSATDRPWQKIHLYFAATFRMNGAVLIATDAAGEEFYPKFPSKAGDFLRELRRGMYREGTGTWFSLEYTITHDYKFHVDYDYDNEPEFGYEIAPSTFLVDLENFPRSEEYIPEWLREKIRRSQEENL